MTEPRPPDPVKPQFLDYRGSNADKPKMSGREIVAGVFSWIGCVLAAFAIGSATQSLGFGLIVFFAALIFLSVYFVAQRAYRGYIPGLLIGAAITCLVPVGIVAAICWSK